MLICFANNDVWIEMQLEHLVEQTEEAVAIQKSKKGCDAGEEDVDIGEDIPVDIFPPVEIEKDDDRSSSSSSSDSSSSSGITTHLGSL